MDLNGSRGRGGAGEFVRTTTTLCRGLSAGRLDACVLAPAGTATLWTDTRTLFVSWPLPALLIDDPDALVACLVLQAAPTKAAAAPLAWQAFNSRELSALHLCEGAAAISWAHETWPGLSEHLDELAGGLTAADWVTLKPTTLAARARVLAKDTTGPLTVPAVLGELLLQGQPRTAFESARRRLAQRVRPLGDLMERLGVTVSLEVPIEGSEEEDVRPNELAVPSDDRGPEDGAAPVAGTGGIPFPEWDHTTQSYRRDFTRVFERKLAVPAQVRGRRSAELEGWFSAPLQRRWQGRLADGSDLDLDAAVDSLVDGRTGSTASERVYRQRVCSERDVACVVLIDSSGSLGQAALLTQEIACTDALVDAMVAAGERHAVFSFWSDTRHHVSLGVLRDFSDRHARPSSASLRPVHHTRLGAALRASVARLLAEPATTRVLLVLTDGRPFDDGYEGEYACADVVKAVEEADLAGVSVALLCVAEREATPLAGLLDGRLHCVATPEDLPRTLGDLHYQLVV